MSHAAEPQQRRVVHRDTSYNADGVNPWHYTYEVESVSLDDPSIVRAIKVCGI